jgi:hypothetical protein
MAKGDRKEAKGRQPGIMSFFKAPAAKSLPGAVTPQKRAVDPAPNDEIDAGYCDAMKTDITLDSDEDEIIIPRSKNTKRIRCDEDEGDRDSQRRRE